MKIQRIAVLGGDQRQIAVAHRLAESGLDVAVWGLDVSAEKLLPARRADGWREALRDAEAVVLPLPASADGVRVHCPLFSPDEMLRLTSLTDAMEGRLLLGGRIDATLYSLAEGKSIPCIDYFENEALQLRNAVPTAEGAIEIAMRELPVTIDGLSTVILGYGRIGAALGERLQALGATVTVYARRAEQRALAQMHRHAVGKLVCRGGRTTPEGDLPTCRVIFNTVPHRILTPEILGKIPRNCLLVDLASPPGGFDQAELRRMGLPFVWGTALPGKCAPETAGEIIAQTILELLDTHSDLTV